MTGCANPPHVRAVLVEVVVAQHGRHRRQRLQFQQDARVADVARMDDVAARGQCRRGLGLQPAVRVRYDAHRRHAHPLSSPPRSLSPPLNRSAHGTQSARQRQRQERVAGMRPGNSAGGGKRRSGPATARKAGQSETAGARSHPAKASRDGAVGIECNRSRMCGQEGGAGCAAWSRARPRRRSTRPGVARGRGQGDRAGDGWRKRQELSDLRQPVPFIYQE